MKKLVALLVAGLCLTAVWAEAGEPARKYKWKLGFNTVAGSIRDVAAKEFKRIVEGKSNGQISVDIFPGEALGTEQEMIEAVKVGALEMQLCGGTALQNLVKEVTPPTLPFMVKDYAEAHALLDGPYGDYVKQKAAAHNLQILSFLDLGFAQITNNKRPIRTPDDIAGIKLRSPNEPTSIATFKALGAAVSTMPFSEVYLALSQGVVDGQFNPLDAIHDTKFHEVQKYLAITNHFYYYIHFMMNKKTWDGLPADLKQVVQEGANAAKQTSREWFTRKDAEMLEKLRPSFKEITYPDVNAFRAKLAPVYANEFTKLVPADAIKLAQETLEKYRKK
jgi:tripartite ATP-independent transporter DctP family solute receptor